MKRRLTRLAVTSGMAVGLAFAGWAIAAAPASADNAFPVGPTDNGAPVSPAENPFPVSPADNGAPVSPADNPFPVGP